MILCMAWTDWMTADASVQAYIVGASFVAGPLHRALAAICAQKVYAPGHQSGSCTDSAAATRTERCMLISLWRAISRNCYRIN
jgi:hypothetical protein